jgi:hypothetical protein
MEFSKIKTQTLGFSGVSLSFLVLREDSWAAWRAFGTVGEMLMGNLLGLKTTSGGKGGGV